MEKRYEKYENAALGLIIQEYGNPDNQFINRLISIKDIGAESEGKNILIITAMKLLVSL